MYKVHLGRLPPNERLPSPTARFMTQRGKKNLSTWSKQLISLLGCLRSSNVIIIPTKALVSVRLISTTAADTIIKAPRFLCFKSCTDEAHKLCFGGKTKHEILSPPQLLSFLLPSLQRSGRTARLSHMQLETDPDLWRYECGSHVLTGARSLVMRQE